MSRGSFEVPRDDTRSSLDADVFAGPRAGRMAIIADSGPIPRS
jgi:hypothetical protein